MGDIHLLITVDRQDKYSSSGQEQDVSKFKIIIYFFSELFDNINERAAARRMKRLEDDFSKIGVNTVGINNDSIIQFISVKRGEFIFDDLSNISSLITDLLNTGLLIELGYILHKTSNYNNKIKISRRIKKISSSVEEIETFFYDISDIVDSCKVTTNLDGVVVNIKSSHIKYEDSLFEVTDKLLDIFESLREVKSRVLELVPGSKFLIGVDGGSITITITA